MKVSRTPPELIYGETFESYAERAGMNATVLKAGRVSMKAMRYEAIHGKESTKSLAFGRIAHTAVLENGLAKDAFAVWTGDKRAGKLFEAFEASAKADGKTVITQSERDQLTAIVSAVHSSPLAHQIIEETRHEVTCLWHDDLGAAKCRWDGISSEWAAEWKTTSKPTPREFENQAFALGYHLGAAHYLAGAFANRLTPKYRIISTQSKPPYDTVVWMLDDALLEHAQEERERIWKQYLECGAAGIYGGHGDEVRILSMPTWAMNNAEVNMEECE